MTGARGQGPVANRNRGRGRGPGLGYRRLEARGWGPGIRAALFLAAAALAGCRRYADFTLPPVSGGDPQAGYAFEAQPGPVFGRGETWDSGDVLNPSVVRAGSGLLNFYSGFDGKTWRTGIARSDDGIRWTGRGLLLSPDPHTWEGSYIAANGAAVADGSRIGYWYQAGRRGLPSIGLARVENGRAVKERAPVLDPGPYMSWDERGAADPDVLRIGPDFYMYYLGQDRARRQRLGVARSADGIHWQKLRSNPILEAGGAGSFDENGLGEPAVWQARGFYWMLYTGRNAAENRRLGLARSVDGVHWQKLPGVFAGTEAWDSKVMCDPSVLADGDTVRVWFGGGDVASPDENLHGQIGYGVLRPVTSGPVSGAAGSNPPAP
jgi:predicted GH43/DUF377 family glycosyl hydrolase